jgi:cytochrome c oxidase assembly factor CtaG
VQWWCAAQGVPWDWTWRPYPGVWLFIALLGGAHATMVWRRRARGGEDTSGEPLMAAFWSGLMVLWLALDWPIGALGAGYLASVHMVQFLLIALVAPPLLLLGVRPLVRGQAGLWRRSLIRRATHPVTTLAIFTVILSVTHWPPVVDMLMVGQVGSFALDIAWLMGGLLFWWPVMMPVPRRAWLGPPVRIGYLVAATLVNTGVFAFLTFSELPVYAVYELAPPIGILSTRDDQRLAGLVMKMGGAVVLWTAITIIFFRWFLDDERPERREPGGPVRVDR